MDDQNNRQDNIQNDSTNTPPAPQANITIEPSLNTTAITNKELGPEIPPSSPVVGIQGLPEGQQPVIPAANEQQALPSPKKHVSRRLHEHSLLLAKYRHRDSSGHFIKEQSEINLPVGSPDVHSKPDPSPFDINLKGQTVFGSDEVVKDEDPPLFSFKVTNPVTYLKHWLNRLLRNEGIDLRIRIRPLTSLAIGIAFASFFAGTGFSVAKVFFPNSSPILKREVAYQGTIQKTSNNQYYLGMADAQLYRLRLHDDSQIKLKDYLNKQVLVKGNLGKEPFVISVNEIISFEGR